MRKLLLLPFLALLSLTIAHADVIDIESSSGVWTSVLPIGATNLSGVGTSSIRWGTPAGAGGQSGYDFLGVPPPTQFSVNPGVVFQLGTFTHLNRPITGTFVTQATLNITMNLQVPGDGLAGGGNVTQTFQYLFSHNETPNSPPCLPGSATVCDDEVKVLNTIPNATINVGGTLYTIEFLGFSQNGGATIVNDFLTAEDASNTADLFGRFTTNVNPTVPEPASIVLLMTVAGGLALLRRKRA